MSSAPEENPGVESGARTSRRDFLRAAGFTAPGTGVGGLAGAGAE